MYRLMIRRFILVTTSLKSSQTPLKSLRFLSTSSEINEKPVISFFENHGFSRSQISVIVKKFPKVLSADPEKSLLPKLLFFQSKGISSPEVAKLVAGCPYILRRSLHKHIIPSFDFIQDLLQSEVKTIVTIKRYVGILYFDLRSYVRLNIEVLRKFGVPQNNIEYILRVKPNLFTRSSIKFKELVEEVKEMGFNPLRYTFVIAVSALQSMSKSTWKKKVEIYRKWGCSEEDVLSAFGRHPVCMLASENKINGVMDYFVNKIGSEPSFLTRNPSLFCYSLNRRIIPRGSVYLVLSSKGLIKKDVNLRMFNLNKKRFLDNFIKPHEKHIPDLLKLYEEKLNIESKEESVKEVKEMGFNPLGVTFVLAVSVLRPMSKSTWKKKVEVYRKWGCPEDEILSAFGRHPACMLASEDKINGVMDYVVNEIGSEPSFLARNPHLFCYSLNRRIIPRGSIYLVLSSKGLMKKDVNLCLFTLAEKGFLDKFIKPNEKHISGLLKLYEEKLKVSESKEV